jgi:hypothetical protein
VVPSGKASAWGTADDDDAMSMGDGGAFQHQVERARKLDVDDNVDPDSFESLDGVEQRVLGRRNGKSVNVGKETGGWVGKFYTE